MHCPNLQQLLCNEHVNDAAAEHIGKRIGKQLIEIWLAMAKGKTS